MWALQKLHHLQLWVTLSERYLSSKGVDWPKAERFCFNEWSNPDDDELGLQIVRVSDVVGDHGDLQSITG